VAGSPWFRYLLCALVIVLGIWAFRQVLSLWFRARINRTWGAVARRLDLDLDPYSTGTLPRMRGRAQRWTVTVASERRDGPGGALQTRFHLALEESSPVRLRLSRSGPLSLLGDLARSGFRDGGEDPDAASLAEGNPETIRALVTGPLRTLVNSFDDWTFRIEGRDVELSKPGIADSGPLIGERLEMLCAVAEALESEERDT
jgi:hypothetical protein